MQQDTPPDPVALWSNGRAEPFTVEEILQVPCCRCGAPSYHQWQVCADLRVFRSLCLECDIALNRLVLTWAGCPDVEAKMSAYELDQRA